MRDLLLSIATPQSLSWIGFLLLAIGSLGGIALLVDPFDKHWSHKPLGFIFPVVVLVGYLIGHIGDDEIAARFERRATTAEKALEKIRAQRQIKNRDALIARLRAFGGVPFDMGVQTDAEPVELLGQLSQALSDAGWDWKPAAGTILFNIPGKPAVAPIVMSGGVQIKLAKSRLEQWGKAAGALAEALKAENITVAAFASADVPDGAIHVNVGTKPRDD